LNIQISQGSAATEFRIQVRWKILFYRISQFRPLSTNPKVKEILKFAKVIVNIKVAPFYVQNQP